MRFGFAAVIDVPLRNLGPRAELVEALGFHRYWLPDERLTRNVYAGLTVSALHTRRMELGIAVTNPYTRNAAVTAAAAATIDEFSGQRLALGLGAGGGLGHYGIDQAHPAVAVRETVHVIRELLAGKTVSYEGRHVRMNGATLDFTAARQIPIYIAARGPKLLELAGEIADGAIIGGFASDAGIERAKEAIARGLEKAGRSWADIDLAAWLYTSVADDPAPARRAVSRLVTTSLVTSRPILQTIGVEIPTPLRECLEASAWTVGQEAIDRCSQFLSDEILDAFSVAGTPETCAYNVARIARHGVKEIAFVSLPSAGDTPERLAERIASEVIPAVKSELQSQGVAR